MELEDKFNLKHIQVTDFPFDRQFHGKIGHREYQCSFLMEDHMRMLTSSPPSPTATIACCPQCAAAMIIKLVEPDLKDPLKERHVFECQECGLPRAYLIDRERSLARH